MIGNFNSTAQKQKDPVNRILFIFDASQSMLARWESGRKIDIARNLLNNMLDSLKHIENLEIGLRVYGHQKPVPPQDCSDTKLEIYFQKSNLVVDRMKTKLKMIRARGTTPIANSLEKGAFDFPNDNARNIIILITDGLESCDGDPCAVSRLFQRKGIILRPFVIGIGLDESYKSTFDCVGTYFDASKEKDFEEVLQVVISHVLNSTTAQVNLLDINGNPTETNINMTFYDEFTGVSKYNYIHTMNHKGNPDTMVIDPVLSYKVIAHTIPPVESEIIKLTPGKHTIIPIETPQGELEIEIDSRENYQFIVRKNGEKQTLNIQETNTKQKYLVGTYDIEVLTIPRVYFEDVEIKQSFLTNYHIATPATVNILLPSKGYGGIYQIKEDKLELVYTLNINTQKETVFLLQGNYKIIFRAKNSKQYIFTKEKKFTLKSGQTKLLKLY